MAADYLPEEPLTFPRLLDRIYPIPRDTVSLEQFERRRHRDLPDLADEVLRQEADRCRLRLWIEENPMHEVWLRERHDQLRAELRRRAPAASAPRPAAPTGRPCTPVIRQPQSPSQLPSFRFQAGDKEHAL